MNLNFEEILTPFENKSCGGYHEDIKGGAFNIVEYIKDHLEEENVEQMEFSIDQGEDSPGFSCYILSVAYVDEGGNLELITFELTSC